VAKPCEIINRYDKPRVDKICELGNVLVSAAYMFQSMPQAPDGSDDENAEQVCVSLSLSVFSYTVHTQASSDEDDDLVRDLSPTAPSVDNDSEEDG
jgi:hypothetical protein